MINIKDTFLRLTRNLTPLNSEDEIIKLLSEFKFKEDNHGNYYILVKKSDGTYSDTMFTSHLDTVVKNYHMSHLKVIHNYEGDFITTDGYTNLGADDKAGVVLMLNMISENIPGLYYFFRGEETGTLGSLCLSNDFDMLVKTGCLPKISRCISFDRRGYDKITTHQKSKRCCSNKFAKELSDRMNDYGFWYKPDDFGGKTDSYNFIDNIPECTNLSVGYFNEHTISENQDIEFLELLSILVININWDSLPTYRTIEPKVDDIKDDTKKDTKENKGNLSDVFEYFNKCDILDEDFEKWYDSRANSLSLN